MPVAYRGLWDKFAAPGTPGAIQRAFLRGVPTLASIERGTSSLADVLALAANPAINARRQSLYLSTLFLPSPDEMRLAGTAAVFAVQPGRHDRSWPLWVWTGRAWVPHGCYIPLEACARLGQPTPHLYPGALVLYESGNVGDAATRVTVTDDATTSRVLTEMSQPDTRVLRVSDLVELDLRRLVQGAAA